MESQSLVTASPTKTDGCIDLPWFRPLGAGGDIAARFHYAIFFA